MRFRDDILDGFLVSMYCGKKVAGDNHSSSLCIFILYPPSFLFTMKKPEWCSGSRFPSEQLINLAM